MATATAPKITRTIARKVLNTVDAGLCSGLGKPELGKMCVEAAVCFALGLPHSDDPKCVSKVVRSLKIGLNDRNWSSNAARAKGLRRLALAQLGSNKIDDQKFMTLLAEKIIRKLIPRTLRLAAKKQKPEHKKAMLAAADKCEREGTQKSAREARKIADAADAAYAAAGAAYAAAYAAADAAADAVRDEFLAFFAELMVEVLVEMKAPGVKFLDLAEESPQPVAAE